MTEFLNSLSLDQINCHQHNQIANFICLDKQCQKRGVVCGICQTVYHKQHEIKPLKYFLNQLIKSQQQSNKIALITSQIDLISSEIKQSFRKFPKLEDQNQLQKALNIYQSELHQRIKNEFTIEKDLRAFFQRNPIPQLKKINQFITKYQLHEYEPQIPVENPLTNQEKFLYQMKQSLKQKKDDFNDLLKSKAELKDILGLFVFTQVKQKVGYHFSQTQKHTSITIVEKLKATQAHNYSSNFALIEPVVIGKKKEFSKKTVKIKIQKLNSWVNLGICVKSKAISANYYFNTQDIGHGAYTISNDGYSWHNTDSGLNSYYHGWSFAQDDIIQMTYDPKTKTIKYQKQNSDKDHQLLCQPVLGEEMCFCVTLNTHDQSVSIVE